MSQLLEALVSSPNFTISSSSASAFLASPDLREFTCSIFLAQGLSRKHAFQHLETLSTLAKSTSSALKTGFLIRFFQLLDELKHFPSDYEEMKFCLLTKQTINSFPPPTEGSQSKLQELLMRSVEQGVNRLLIAAKSQDATEAVREALEAKCHLLGEDLLFKLQANDSKFLSGKHDTQPLKWYLDCVKRIVNLIKGEHKVGKPTLLWPLLYIGVKCELASFPEPTLYQQMAPLLQAVFSSEQMSTLVSKPSPSPSPPATLPLKNMNQGLRELYNKVFADIEREAFVEIEQITYECELLISGNIVKLKKNGKQDLFEAFDTLMGSETATKKTLQCWKLMLKGVSKLGLYDSSEWSALQEKFSRLGHRNQYLRDIGKKKPSRTKPKVENSLKTERRDASFKKRSEVQTQTRSTEKSPPRQETRHHDFVRRRGKVKHRK